MQLIDYVYLTKFYHGRIMTKRAILILLNLLNFARPRLVQLDYARFVIDHKAFFLISWEIKKGYRLKIKKLNYQTFISSGSAYIAIPESIDHLDLVISNLWRSYRVPVTLIRQTVSAQVDFFPVKQFAEITKRSIYSPQIKLLAIQPKLTAKITRLRSPEPIINNQNLNQA
jgi:hypothetical protein